MRKFLTTLAIIAVAILFTNCGGGSFSDPRVVADKFMDANLVKADPDEMMKYCDEDAKEMIREGFYEVRESAPEFYEYMVSQIRAMEVQIVRDEESSLVDDDEAVIYYDVYAKAKPENKERASVALDKDDKGNWLVTDWFINPPYFD